MVIILGSVYNSIPTGLAENLKSLFRLRAFVESGLAQGTSTLWACKHFDTVISIEADRQYIDKFKAAYPESRAKIIEGDSAIEMLDVVNGLTVPALFWLDGHTDDYCPVIEELIAINFSTLPHVIMIDDWRLFGTFRNWPSKDKVVMFASNLGTRNIYDVDDVLIASPKGYNAVPLD